MSRRSLLSSLLVIIVATISWGCSSETAHAVPGAEQARALERRFDELDEEYRSLPVDTPEQVAAHTKLRQRFSTAKIIFRSKERAGLGTITEERFRSISADLGEIEDLIRDFPR
jgi:hypothetical protein